MTTLEWIKLNNNMLTTVRYELIEPILSTLKHIDIYSKLFCMDYDRSNYHEFILSENPLVCDCEMKWYKKWWMSGYQSVDTDHIKDITCTDVSDGKKHLMKDVNLEHMYCVQDPAVDGPDTVAALSSARVPSSFFRYGLPVVIISYSLGL